MKTAGALHLACAAVLLSACAAPSFIKGTGGVEYYGGTTGFFSPDGRLPYGSSDSAVKREVAEGGGMIIETFTQPGVSPGMPPEEHITTLTRIGRSLSYSVSEYGSELSGTVTFSGRGLDKWTYDLALEGRGYLTGTGEIKGDALVTEKKLDQPGRPMLIRDSLKKVSRESYSRQVAGMKPLPGTE
ncbi:MAG: hypothetical protein FD189_1401 [Elusimicrobia bacterium]|nr:MAG: hypothetical protein FD154_1402 [Elusimicrobiota bacterium]KAF0155485.1 MAG: hypothetical protein FD189_1401 [Elusimicrobiota bacterium]